MFLRSRIDTDTGGEPDKEEIDLSKVTSAKVSSLFLDPGGNHLLVSTKNEGGAKPALLYLHRSRHQPRQVSCQRTFAKFHVLNCESAKRGFLQGEGPSRGLLRAL